MISASSILIYVFAISMATEVDRDEVDTDSLVLCITKQLEVGNVSAKSVTLYMRATVLCKHLSGYGEFPKNNT